MARLAAFAMIVVMACTALSCAAAAEVAKKGDRIVVHPQQTTDVLINPGVGWQLLVGADPSDEMERMPLVSTYYYRTSWTEFEPQRGRYENSPAVRRIDRWLAEAAKYGRYVAIRVVPWNSQNPEYQRMSAQKVKGCDSPVPAYIFAEGADGFPEPGGSGGWVPVFWDPVYLKYHQKLAEFLGKRYANHPNLAYIDVPAANYGEMNLTNTGVPQLDDLSLWRKHGLTAASWRGMVEQLCDMYRGAFPHDLLVAARDYVLYPGGREALPYAVKKGVGFRDDGLGMDYCGPGQTNPEYEGHWQEALCLYENSDGSWLDLGDEARVRRILDWAIDRTHASIVMVGKWNEGQRSYDRYQSLVTEYGKRLGYRLVVQEASLPATVAPGADLPVTLAWQNLGNAPPYVSFALKVELLGPSGKLLGAATVAPEKLGTTTWTPSARPQTEVALPILKDVPPGSYRVAITLFEPKAASAGQPLDVRRPIRLGIRGGDARARYVLGRVTVK